jgi:ribosomal protein S18 acetylase RimI-like enzyme
MSDGNFAVHAGWVQRHTRGMRVIDDGELILIDSGLPCDAFNIVCSARLDPARAPTRIREAVDYFRRVSRPFSWWVGPADQPGDLGDHLIAAGLQQAETELAMAVDLTAPLPSRQSPGGLRIARVYSEPALSDYARVLSDGAAPDPHVLRFYELAAGVLLANECPLQFYVGYLDDMPVATAELTVADGVAGLYGISTLERYRRKGIGTALTLHALFAGRKQGCRTAILQAAPDAVGLYRRVGFQGFGEITEYKP